MSNELKPDWAAHQVDPAVARLWREHGGDHHGPRVETVTMPMSRLMGFVSDLGASAASPESAQIQPLEDKSPDIVAFLKTLNGYPDRLVEAAALQAANRIARLERELGEARKELEWPWAFPPIEMANAQVLAIRNWNDDGPMDERVAESVEALLVNLGHIRLEQKAAESRHQQELGEARAEIERLNTGGFTSRDGGQWVQKDRRDAAEARVQCAESERDAALDLAQLTSSSDEFSAFSYMRERAQSAESRLEAARVALEPFAAVWDYDDVGRHFLEALYLRNGVLLNLTNNDMRRAREAIALLKKENSQ